MGVTFKLKMRALWWGLILCLGWGLLASCGSWAQGVELHCSQCGKELKGRYYVLEGRYYCTEDMPRCSKCGRRLTGKYYRDSQGKNICQKDFLAQAPTCSVCKRKVVDQAFTVYRDGLVACATCKAAGLPQCFLCRLPIREGGLVFSDGRRSCEYHSHNIVTTQAQAQTYFNKAWKLIARYVSPKITYDPRSVSVHIVDYNLFLERLRNSPNHDDESRVYGLTNTYGPSSNPQKAVSQVFLLQGLPSADALSTMVHECGHVWQQKNRKIDLDLLRSEGFCQWLSYKVNVGLRRQDQVRILLDRDDPYYGQGLQYYLQLERRGGLPAVFRYAVGG